MSDSRLEKFIYAICSMDVSDLPVPLSRIEKLWNCLITGETPDFEPLSRNEKYLMAMLDRYDISNLPAPMSRGEKLLYKIAVGETDLSDVPGYLSRYEELLKYLIENGGISGGDFEYVLYTLNQSLSTLYTTAEKPVKSAILKGQTLINLMTNYKNESLIEYNQPLVNPDVANISMMKPNTVYTLLYKAKYQEKGNTGKLVICTTDDSNKWITTSSNLTTSYAQYAFKFSTLSDVKCFVLRSNGHYFHVKECILLEGDYTNADIPYFEGMQSVKMPVLTTTGKNLLSSSFQLGWINTSNGSVSSSTDKIATIDLIKVLPSTEYAITRGSGTRSIIAEFDDDENYLGYIGGDIFTTKSNTTKIRIFINVTTELIGHSLTVGANNKITYEPYKSNILTVNEPIELCGIGDVRDTLDLMTGEVVERIGEIIIDENSNIAFPSYCENVDEGYFKFATDYIEQPKNNNYISNKLQKINVYELTNAVGFTLVGGRGKHRFLFCIKSSELSELSLNGCKQWLSQNPITIQYALETESVKTVDLTTVDQDNQPTQLGTFENVTHVLLESAGLIPTVEMEVATRINKTLSTMGLQHHELSETQNKLGQTIDEQAENTDATMMATTEIYEQTL